jgi:hypothetical protein
MSACPAARFDPKSLLRLRGDPVHALHYAERSFRPPERRTQRALIPKHHVQVHVLPVIVRYREIPPAGNEPPDLLHAHL